MQIEDVAKANVFKLLGTYLKGAKQLASLEKAYVGQAVGGHVKTLSIGLVLAIAGGILLALGGLTLLVTLILFLNTWFLPWASALIVTAGLLLIGLILVVIGSVQVKKDVEQTKAAFDQVGEDIRCVRQK